jgi:hypothetical protein
VYDIRLISFKKERKTKYKIKKEKTCITQCIKFRTHADNEVMSLGF